MCVYSVQMWKKLNKNKTPNVHQQWINDFLVCLKNEMLYYIREWRGFRGGEVEDDEAPLCPFPETIVAVATSH
jgi:hypothetical protein